MNSGKGTSKSTSEKKKKKSLEESPVGMLAAFFTFRGKKHNMF